MGDTQTVITHKLDFFLSVGWFLFQKLPFIHQAIKNYYELWMSS